MPLHPKYERRKAPPQPPPNGRTGEEAPSQRTRRERSTIQKGREEEAAPTNRREGGWVCGCGWVWVGVGGSRWVAVWGWGAGCLFAISPTLPEHDIRLGISQCFSGLNRNIYHVLPLRNWWAIWKSPSSPPHPPTHPDGSRWRQHHGNGIQHRQGTIAQLKSE